MLSELSSPYGYHANKYVVIIFIPCFVLILIVSLVFILPIHVPYSAKPSFRASRFKISTYVLYKKSFASRKYVCDIIRNKMLTRT